MPYLTRPEIEAIAQRVIMAYRRLPSQSEGPQNRVQPEPLICELLGLSMEYHRLSRHGSILGLTACGEVGVQIFDDPERPEYYYLDGKTLLIETRLAEEGANIGRLHFTQIHEACHQIYKMLFPREYKDGSKYRKIHYCVAHTNQYDNDWEEWRTNALTSAVLMPVDMLLENMVFFGLGDKIRLLNRVFAAEQYEHFSKMAEYMGVSKRALAIRMKQLGLLEKEYLANPYNLVAVFPDDGEKV